MSNIEKNSAEEYTLDIFNEFLVEEIPCVLKRNVVSGKARNILEFNLKDTAKNWSTKTATFQYSSETNQYDVEVIKDVFLKQMQSICLSGCMTGKFHL